MCGIAGIICRDGINIQQVQRMTQEIQHRGPDGDGHWINKTSNVGLGHRRLAIIDLSDAGSQPMISADNRYVIVFNGEIYNYLEIKDELIKKGYQFFSNSDTEVLLNLYIDKGVDCLNDLDGMFAFTIWDELEKKLFCARDRFGEKPFFYNVVPGKQFAFASEMKSLWKIGVDDALNFKMVSRYFNDIYYLVNPFDLSETFYKDILRLEPAHYLLVNEKCEVTKKKYWTLSPDKINNRISFQEATDEFRELFFTSIQRRLRSDVPVGSSLSGGLDSSSIVCAIHEMHKNNGLRQNTFSARFPGFEKDEGKYMDSVLQHTHINGFFTYPDQDAFMKQLTEFLYHQEEPVASASQYVQWEVMKLAKQKGVTVLLDGQGADETLTGYDHYFLYFFRELEKNRMGQLNTELNAFNQLHSKNLGVSDFSAVQHEVKQASGNVLTQKLLSYRPIKKTWYRFKANNSFFSPDFLAEIWPDNEKKYSADPLSLNQSLWNDTFLGKLEVLLRYSDRNSMAFSREVRLPFLNHKLVEFLFSLPSDYKIHHGWSKYVLRKSMEPYLPEDICWRRDKIGYEAPQQDWFSKPYMQELVADSQSVLEKENILNKNRKGDNEHMKWQTLIVGQMLNSKK